MGGVVDLAKQVYSPIFGGLLGSLKPKQPKVPKLPEPPKYDAEDAKKKAQQAALMKKKAAQSAFGFEDTVLTSPGGLGAVPSIYQGNKTLTGT